MPQDQENPRLGNNDSENRLILGDRYIHGSGFEIGAGASPSRHAGVTEQTFIDLRDRAEIEDLFGETIRYRVVDLESALAQAQVRPADFVIAHHVLEHTPNPIATLCQWIALLGPGGRFFLSIPSESNPCEEQRVPTPIEHLIDDYLFDRDGDDYESKGHILSFINQWASLRPNDVWYAGRSVQEFVSVSLNELRRSGHDLHWHTLTQSIAKMTLEAAFHFADQPLEWQFLGEAAGSIYMVGERAAGVRSAGSTPAFLSAHRERLRRAASRIDRPASS